MKNIGITSDAQTLFPSDDGRKKDLPLMTVLTARGRDSLTEDQFLALSQAAQVRVHSVPSRLKDKELISICKDTEILGITRRATADIGKETIDGLPNLKGIAIYASGYDWIDLEALKKRGIALAVLPDYSVQTVAEHTWGMILTMSRRLHLSDRIVQEELPAYVSLRGWELAGKTMGLIGFGRIGRAIAQMARGFSMNVYFYDRQMVQSEFGIATTFPELLSIADVVVLACNYERGKPPLMDASALALMKRGATLINPARKALVDHESLLPAILEHRLAGYAVDDHVYSREQLAGVEAGRIFQTRHTAWYSNEAMARGTQCWVDNLCALARNQAVNRII